jgi:FlaA1/EpsC-like NDP-sugar epimerase
MVNFFNSLRILPRWIIILLDLAIVANAAFLGYLLRFNFEFGEIDNHDPILGISVYLGCALLASFFTKSYAGIIRYTGLQDGVRLMYAILLTSLLVVSVNLSYYYNQGSNLIPFSVILITVFTSFLFLFSYRLAVKYIFSFYGNAIRKRSNVMIFGAGQSGLITKQVIDSDTASRRKVVGFLEDSTDKTGKVLNGTTIYDATKDITRLFTELEVSELVISIMNLSLERKNEIVDICLKTRVKVRSVPPLDKWVKGELSLNQIKEVHIEDLLGRASIQLSNEYVNKQLVGQVVLITGAAGSIGSEIVRQVLSNQPKRILLFDQAETPLYHIDREVVLLNSTGIEVISILGDITNKDVLEEVFVKYEPNTVFHAAAYKHVPMVEDNPFEAISCNVMGTKLLADLSLKYHVDKFVMISTDKAVNPTNVMGCTKRLAEMYVQSMNDHHKKSDIASTIFVTTRFGNVLGSNGSVIPLFKKQISEGGPITVTHPDITRYFMTIPEACQLVLEAGAMGRGGEIFIFDMGQSIKIVDLAKKMVQLSGLTINKDIEIIYTGLRDGEKLYEELLIDGNNNLPTHHEKIMIAQVRKIPFLQIENDIKLLNGHLYNRNELESIAFMKKVVPEYVSNSSRFEVLDK